MRANSPEKWGVRPSSGAAILDGNGDLMKSGASARSELAAPEDGRTPMMLPYGIPLTLQPQPEQNHPCPIARKTA